ncbi:hypothetical protein DRW03_21145 [Corallococcus sp. H22C18031201]|nr:hypothetical protein DRW03_21145 [Corallococcus sp. H22C18031201]
MKSIIGTMVVGLIIRRGGTVPEGGPEESADVVTSEGNLIPLRTSIYEYTHANPLEARALPDLRLTPPMLFMNRRITCNPQRL